MCDRVGVGWMSGSCGDCMSCMTGRDMLCEGFEGLISHERGGFATHVKVNYKYAFLIPESIESENASEHADERKQIAQLIPG